MDIEKIANNLTLSGNEIWISKTARQIAFPEDGHWECSQVEADSFWFEHRNNCLLTLIRNFSPEGAIFDIGAGNGYVSKALASNGFEMVVVEPGIEGASNAKKQGLTVICSSLEDAGFFPNSLPAIGLFDVLEHIEDDINFLKQIKNVLQFNGRLYLTVPAYNWLWSVEDEITGHYRRYNLQKLTRMFIELGYKVDYASYFFSFLPLPIFLLRTIPSKLGWRQEGSLETTRSEHDAGSGLFRKILNNYLAIELSAIKTKRVIPFGGSCLITASLVKK
jgi:2-polyprenyl-3-methyl-5-hydroxy-6-metoxy-1,4-benzoquinol methylase